MDSQLQLEDFKQGDERAGFAQPSAATARRSVMRKSTPRTSPYKRARAARLLREGESYAQTAREVGVNKRTIARWMQDESFLAMLHGHGVMALGPVQVRAADADVLQDLPAEESWLWVSVPDGVVLGSLLVEEATHLRVAFVTAGERAEAVRASLEQQRFPVVDGERTAVLVPAALEALQDPKALDLLVRICTADPAEAFRAFLSVWHFRVQETKDVRVLGADLWPAQETFIAEIAEHPHVYALKARKLGQSTIACAYDAYVLRFRDPNARVHLFSRRERAALELLTAVRFGLERLPWWLRLPARTTAREIELDAGRTTGGSRSVTRPPTTPRSKRPRHTRTSMSGLTCHARTSSTRRSNRRSRLPAARA